MSSKTAPLGTYSDDWIERLDGRTRLAQAVRDRLSSLESDLGGRDLLSYQELSIAKRAIWLETLIEQREAALARGQEIDQGAHVQAINSLIGVWKSLGLKRRAREAPTVAEYLRGRSA